MASATPAFAIETSRAAKPLSESASIVSEYVCPRCLSNKVRAHSARTVWGKALSAFGVKRLQCRQCFCRFSWI